MSPPDLVFTQRALADLRGLRKWIAQSSGAARADAYVDRILQPAALLAANPRMGRERPEISPGLRSFVVHPYILFYRPLADGVRISRVVHGHREIHRALGEPDPTDH